MSALVGSDVIFVLDFVEKADLLEEAATAIPTCLYTMGVCVSSFLSASAIPKPGLD